MCTLIREVIEIISVQDIDEEEINIQLLDTRIG